MSVNMCTLCVPSYQESCKCMWECNEAVMCYSYVALVIAQLMVWVNGGMKVTG
jgi:hypothetical protein